MKKNFWKLATFTLNTLFGLLFLFSLIIVFVALYMTNNPSQQAAFFDRTMDIDNFTFPLSAFGNQLEAGMQALSLEMLYMGILLIIGLIPLYFFFRQLIRHLEAGRFFERSSFRQLSLLYLITVLFDIFGTIFFNVLNKKIISYVTTHPQITYHSNWDSIFVSVLIYAILIFLYKKAIDFREESLLTI